jgi:hypothetical protein
MAAAAFRKRARVRRARTSSRVRAISLRAAHTTSAAYKAAPDAVAWQAQGQRLPGLESPQRQIHTLPMSQVIPDAGDNHVSVNSPCHMVRLSDHLG